MILRSKMQTRAMENLTQYTEYRFKGQRVTKGYVLGAAFDSYRRYIDNEALLWKAIEISDVKDAGTGIPVNFSIRTEVQENLNAFKAKLDELAGRSFFPAQIIDILLICVTNEMNTPVQQAENVSKPLTVNIEIQNFKELDLAEQNVRIYELLLELREKLQC